MADLTGLLMPLAGPVPRCAVVGAGLAGVAAAWHLLALAGGQGRPLAVDLYDAAGLGAGASGAAAGLLHPFSPRGKVLWRGEEALSAALDLVAVAESAAEAAGAPEPFVWRQPLFRPATDARQAQGFARVQLPRERAVAGAWSEVARRAAVLPAEEGGGPEGEEGLLVHGGLVLDLRLYLRWVWAAAEELAGRQPGCGAALRRERVASLAALQAERGPYREVVLATGAVVNSLAGSIGQELPVTLSQGYTLRLAPPLQPSPPQAGSLPASLLGSTYAAVQGERTVVGSTRREVSLAEAEATCGRAVPPEEAQQAAGELLPRATRLSPALGGWRMDGVQSGVRAQPPPSPKGSIPLAGLLSASGPGGGRVWAVTGLGARGLLYHAWLGRQLAAALLGGGGEAALDPALRRWQRPP